MNEQLYPNANAKMLSESNLNLQIDRKSEEKANRYRIENIKKFIDKLNECYKKYNGLKKTNVGLKNMFQYSGMGLTLSSTILSILLVGGVAVPIFLPISVGLGISTIMFYGLNKVHDIRIRKYRNLETLSQNELLEVKQIFSKAIDDGNITENEHNFILNIEDKFNKALRKIKIKHRKEVDEIFKATNKKVERTGNEEFDELKKKFNIMEKKVYQ